MRVCQDRREEKAFLTRAGVPVAPNLTLLPGEPLPALPSDLFPAILKTAREGWTDGGSGPSTRPTSCRGPGRQRRALRAGKRLPLGGLPALTLRAARAVPSAPCPWCKTGTAAASWIRPAPRPMPALEAEAQRIAEHIIAALDYVGVLTVEFFLVGGQLLVNEMAPRPTTPAIPASTTPVAASSSCRCAPCAICRCRHRLRFSPPSCSTCSGICGKTAPDWAGALACRRAPAPLRQGRGPPWSQMGHVTVTGRDWPAVEVTAHQLRALLACRPAKAAQVPTKDPGQAGPSAFVRRGQPRSTTTATGAGSGW